MRRDLGRKICTDSRYFYLFTATPNEAISKFEIDRILFFQSREEKRTKARRRFVAKMRYILRTAGPKREYRSARNDYRDYFCRTRDIYLRELHITKRARGNKESLRHLRRTPLLCLGRNNINAVMQGRRNYRGGFNPLDTARDYVTVLSDRAIIRRRSIYGDRPGESRRVTYDGFVATFETEKEK